MSGTVNYYDGGTGELIGTSPMLIPVVPNSIKLLGQYLSKNKYSSIEGVVDTTRLIVRPHPLLEITLTDVIYNE